MIKRLAYLCLLFVTVAACKENAQVEKKLYPTKVVIGGTTHEFHYDAGRIYSVTTNRPGFYEEVTYHYYDEYFRKPDHKYKDKIFEVLHKPDKGPIGWDRSDSIKSKQEWLSRLFSDSGLVTDESLNVYLSEEIQRFKVKNKYSKARQLVESTFFFYVYVEGRKTDMEDTKYISKQVKYNYDAGKLAKALFYGPGSQDAYLQVELEYDDKPGYLKYLPLEARFLPLELPYRNHNITSYTIKDRYGKVRKDLSYTCEYTYNKDGYPREFIRKMLDGREVKGYIVYRAGVGDNSSQSIAG